MGSGPSVGATHFSILTAHYTADVRKLKTALLEWNDSEDFERLQKVRKAGRAGGRSFEVGGVSCLKKAGDNEVLQKLLYDFDCVIIDFGPRTQEKEKIFFMCDRSFLIGSVSEWQLDHFAGVIISGEFRANKAEYLISFGDTETMHLMEKKLGIRIRKIPWNMNPFNLNGEMLQFYAGLV